MKIFLGVECLAGNNSLGFGDSSDHDTDTKIFKKNIFIARQHAIDTERDIVFANLSVCLSVTLWYRI